MHGCESGDARPPACRRAVTTLTTILLLASSACAMRRADGTAVDTSVITHEEIDSIQAVTAFEAVYKLRPKFLISRGAGATDAQGVAALPNVYVDNQYYGDITALKYIAAATIQSVKYFSGSEAQFKFGRGNAAGVIGILTKH